MSDDRPAQIDPEQIRKETRTTLRLLEASQVKQHSPCSIQHSPFTMQLWGAGRTNERHSRKQHSTFKKNEC
jgi:hypothetical protein